MDEKLQTLLESLFDSEDNTGCDGGLTVCDLSAVNNLKRKSVAILGTIEVVELRTLALAARTETLGERAAGGGATALKSPLACFRLLVAWSWAHRRRIAPLLPNSDGKGSG